MRFPPAIPDGPGRNSPLLTFLAANLLVIFVGAAYAQTTEAPEIASREEEPAFKLLAQRNLVLVRVVVRDARGAVVSNLQQADFQLFDRGKKQAILNFSMEKPLENARQQPGPSASMGTGSTPQIPDQPAPDLPRRFLGLFFDDINTDFEGLARSRQAAQRFLAHAVQPGDRVGIFTSSGIKQLDFTSDLASVQQVLLALQPRPMSTPDTCVTILPYEAYLIVELQDQQAISVATQELRNCGLISGGGGSSGGGRSGGGASSGKSGGSSSSSSSSGGRGGGSASGSTTNSEVQGYAQRVETESENASRTTLSSIESLVRRMESLPGQRNIVIVSEGFLSEMLLTELDKIANRALRSNVIINAIDARGMYVDSQFDASQQSPANTLSTGVMVQKEALMKASAQEQSNALAALAQSTGGIFFENSNDLEDGLRRASAVPETYYLLAFSPQNLKLDGAFHPLKVSVVSGRGLIIEARKGYFAPAKPADPAAQEKEEIQEAVFSQDEMRGLPIDVHTEFFMKSRTDGQVDVDTHLDLRKVQFHREADRNVDRLTFAVALFDRDGHFAGGQQKVVELRLRDVTLQKYLQTGITIQSEVAVAPGTYLVRTVVREAESGQISGMNRTVDIPY